MTKNIGFLFFFLLLSSPYGYAQVDNSNDHEPYTIKSTETPIFDNDETIKTWLKENNIPALGLGIIDRGQLQEIRVFGEMKKETPASYNTIFNVASLTKPVTAMVALHLISSGEWELDEPLYKYWTDPDIAGDPRNQKLTTRLVLSHQTGFPNWRWMNGKTKLDFDFEPGTKYQYSGEGFEYLRKALESKFKKSLDQLARELIFQPLKMEDTRYIWSPNTDESRFATGHDENGKPYEIVKNKTANAADDLLTTIGDYGRFLVSIMQGGGLNESVYREMLKPQVQSRDNKYFGLGFEMYDLGNGEYAYAHGGSDFGTRCIAFFLPETKQGLLIFTNSDTGVSAYEKLVKHYLGARGERIFDIETK